MRAVGALLLSATLLAAIACTGGAPESAPTASPQPTPDIQATVDAGIAATREADDAIEATITARVEATRAAEPTAAPTPTATPVPTQEPTPRSRDEKLVSDFFDCVEGNLTIAGAFTSGYDGPLSEQVQTVLDAAGDVTIYLDDQGAFETAMFVAMDTNPLVAPAVLAINIGCWLIKSDETPGTSGPEAAPTPEPVPTQEHDPEGTKCDDLAERVIALSQEEDTMEGSISEISGIVQNSDNLLGIECKGLAFRYIEDSVKAALGWTKFHQNRLGSIGYEWLEPEDYECADLVPMVIESSSGHVLGISDIAVTERNDNLLKCRGTVKTIEREGRIEISVETRPDGRIHWGWGELDKR